MAPPPDSSRAPAGADTRSNVRPPRGSPPSPPSPPSRPFRPSRPSHRSRIVAVMAVVAMAAPVAVGVVADPAVADSGTKTRDPIAIAQEKLDAARGAATDAATKLAAAETARAQVANDIADLEREIPQLQARAAELRVVVRERAAALYMRGGAPALDHFVGASDALAAAGASHLTNVVTAHDVDLATELR